MADALEQHNITFISSQEPWRRPLLMFSKTHQKILMKS
jgi:hypothetical protein